MKNAFKTGAPSFIHSEKNGGFHAMFQDQCRKIKDSQLRVKVVSSNPHKNSQVYIDNYESIFGHK